MPLSPAGEARSRRRRRIESHRGRYSPVVVTDDIMPGVVSLPHGWGHDLPGIQLAVAGRKPGLNSNLLTSTESLDTLSGNAVLNAIPVTVEKR